MTLEEWWASVPRCWCGSATCPNVATWQRSRRIGNCPAFRKAEARNRRGQYLITWPLPGFEVPV